MKNLITNTIIAQAISLGFDFAIFSNDDDLNHVGQTLLDFFYVNSDNLETIEAECEVPLDWQHLVIYGGYECYGEIVDFSAHWHKPAGTKIYHSEFPTIDADGKVKRMKLYHLVGETEYNTEKN